MRSLGTATVLLALLLTGCGSGDGDANDVPTITTRPSTPATSAPTTATSAPSSVVTTEPSSSAPTSPATESEPPLTETAGPSPEPPTDDPVGPTTLREARARIRDSGSPIATGLPRFTVDDDLIYCLLDDPVIGPSCELSRGFVKDDKLCGGAAEGVGRIETFEGEARPVCNSDTIREPGAEDVLGDGVISDGGDVRCLVEGPRTSVTCIDLGASTGFFLAPREYHVF